MEPGTEGSASRPRPGRTGVLALVLLATALCATTPPVAAGEPVAITGYRGLSLEAALLDLRGRGLAIVFTSRVVTPDLVVVSEPDLADDPRSVLDEILKPHGLEVLEGPDGTLVVVPARNEGTGAGTVRGAVVGEPDAGPLERATVRETTTGAQATTDASGRFELGGLGPGLHTLEARAAGYLAARATVDVRSSPPPEVVFLLEPSTLVVEEVVVLPSRISLLVDAPTAELALERDQVQALPHLGDDIFRALSLLPGVATNDVTARIQVRGGRRDETEVLLDGEELHQAFHLRDYDDAASVVAPSTLASAQLSTGGFSAARGDRMGGVMDMTTRIPGGSPHGWAGVGILGGEMGGGGPLRRGRGHWLAEARGGSLGVVSQLLDSDDPVYWDTFFKGEISPGERDTVRAHGLAAGDGLHSRRVTADGIKEFDTSYGNAHTWLTHQRLLGRRSLLETAVSKARIEGERSGLEREETGESEVSDLRDTRIEAARQALDHRVGRHEISWGWRVRRIRTRIDYDGSRLFTTPLAAIRGRVSRTGTVVPEGTEVTNPEITSFHGEVASTDTGLYGSDQVELAESLRLETGLRWDRHTGTGETVWSPRLGLAWRAAPSTLVRASWGLYHQSQRPYELQAEDGETSLQPVERAEHRILGIERRLPGGDEGIVLRIEAYQRVITNPRARWENLFEPLNTFPETEPERVLFAAGESRAQGLEVFLQGRRGERLLWWSDYTLAATEDEIDGRWTPRLYDQRHALNLVVDLRLGDAWRLGLAWRFHSGWPTTTLTLDATRGEQGETVLVPVLGPVNGERLPDYHRLDLRLGRSWRVGGGELTAYVDLQNVYDRRNIGGFDFGFDPEEGALTTAPEVWPGLVPSAGMRIEL